MPPPSRNLVQVGRQREQEQEVLRVNDINDVGAEYDLGDRNDGNSRPNSSGHREQFSGASNLGLQIGHNIGSISVASGATLSVGPHHDSLFGSFFDGHAVPTEAERSILEKKERFQSGRKPLRMLELPNRYSPYDQVQSRKIKSKLLQIAQHFRFLDRGFAEYFQVVVSSFDRTHTQQLLVEARRIIAKSHRMDSDQEIEPDPVYVGDLGHFCEEVSRTWVEPSLSKPNFRFTHGNDEDILHYLQDAVEVPYWRLMLGLFSRWRDTSRSLSGQVVLHVLDSVKLELLNKKHHLEEDLQNLKTTDEENISLIVEGINLRIKVLESVWDDTTSYLDDKYDYLSSIFTKLSDTGSTTAIKETGKEEEEIANQQIETAILVAFIILFLIVAIIPGYKAFSISMEINAPGSTADADFWYLIQSSIMSVMGNIVMVIPLLRKHWLVPAYRLMWFFFALGLMFALVSILIYPLLNPGWSSMIAFFGSVTSAAAVLVMTQATARQVNSTIKFKTTKFKND